jgi:hypothetical protein
MSGNGPNLRPLRRATGVFLFLALSGLIPWLFHYGVFSQWILLLHIVVGVVAVVPLAWIFWKHGRAANRLQPTGWRSAGLWAGVGWGVLAASGLWLVGKGIWGVFTPYRMHVFHVAAGIALGGVALFHIARGLARTHFPQRRYADLARPLVVWLAVFAVGAGVIAYARRSRPEPAGHFLPSNARTTTGHAIPARLLMGSASCGSAGCHSTIYKEWLPGAHHYSAIDPFYEGVKTNYIHDRGSTAPRYCAGCHQPVTLLADEPIHPKTQGDGSEGSSCVFCHTIRDTLTRGNANYVVRPPDPYLFELSPHPALRRIAYLLIRLHPAQHNLDFDVKPSQTAEFCGTCHKQYINKQENGWGFVQLQDQYDNWKNGPWHTDPRRNLQCQDCHMHQVRADDPARNAQGFIHDHRILASNTFAPVMLGLPGAQRQAKQWLTGKTVIPEIAKRWPSGPIVPVELAAEGSFAAGKEAALRALVVNRKVGHQFPTGPLDVIQVWLELRVTDARGRTVYTAGTLGPQGQVEGKTTQYRAYLLNKKAQPVYTHSLWNVVGARDKRAIPPGGSDMTEFRFRVPRGTVGPLRCELRLLYHKFNSTSLSQLFPAGNAPKIPIIEVSHTTIEVPLVSPASRVHGGSSAAKTPAGKASR